MTLKEHIDDICNRLGRNEFKSEDKVSNGIVRRLLDALSWPVYDMTVVISEYPVEKRRVDFALCHPSLKPLVFIEVKQVGHLDEDAEKQLFEYAYHEGVPVVILTDGKEWHFFHPIGRGRYKERKVYKLDLFEMDSGESAERLGRYLNYESICIGEATKAIEDDYRNISKNRQIEASLPEAWVELVQEEDELLLEIIAEKTESQCGDKPSGEQVLIFLKNLSVAEPHPREITSPLGEKPPPLTQEKPRSTTDKKTSTRLVVTMPNGEKINHNKAVDTYVEAIENLGLDRVEKVKPKLLSTSSTYRNFRKRGRYYININLSNDQKKINLEKIAEALSVRLQVEAIAKN